MWRRGLARRLGSALLLLTACSSGSRVCSLYACINEARLTGNLSFATTPSRVDARFCAGSECMTTLVDLTNATPLASQCGQWELSSVCLQPSGDGFALTATWGSGETPVPADGTEYHLTLVDHDGGETLLDVTRTMTYTVTQADDCHSCWSGQASL